MQSSRIEARIGELAELIVDELECHCYDWIRWIGINQHRLLGGDISCSFVFDGFPFFKGNNDRTPVGAKPVSF